MSPLPVEPELLRNVATLAAALEDLLEAHGITVEPGSHLEAFLLETYRCDYERRLPFTPDASFDVPRRYRTMFGIVELAEHLVALKDHSEFPRLKSHLALLGTTTSTLNQPSAQTDQAANMLFELFVATWVMYRGKDTRLETPKGSPNPDILTTLDGRRWGFACKTLHSLHPEALVANLRKAVDQVLRSEAEIGVVTVNLKNVIHHHRYWYRMPEGDTPDGAHAWSVFATPQVPYDMLVGESTDIWNNLATTVGIDNLSSLLTSPRVVPGILGWAHTAAGCMLKGTPRASSVRCFSLSALGPVLPWQRQSLDRLKADATRYRTRTPIDAA
jgi:hypothetical protein